MSNTQIIEELKKILADIFSLSLKTQNYHWNVTGPQFKALHEMFEEQYTDYAEAIDETAEHIRSLGEKVNGTFSFMQDHSSITDGNFELNASEMVKDLVSSQEDMINTLQSALEVAGSIDDAVLEDYFTVRLATHRKFKWMLSSSL